jgi:hypothetical protein
MTREEAITYLEDAKIKFKIPKAAVTARKTNEALDMAIKVLEQNNWIPVSERLPEKPTGREWYWSSYHGKDIAADEYIVMIKDAEIPTSLYWTGDVWINVYAQTLDGYNITYEVTAWMPLPKPYQKEGEEHD